MTADHGERVAEIYSGHARGYADFWSPIIRPVACRLLDALPWADAHRVLDIGTGTGALVPDIRRQAPSAVVIGVDRSPGMLALAAEAGTPVALMDASNLALKDEAMDIAVMAFVLFNVQEPVAALAEAARVLRLGGTLGTSTWAADPMTKAAQVWDDELNAHGAIDRLPMPWKNDDLMNTPAKMTGLFSKAGLTTVRAWIERLDHSWDLDAFVVLRMTFGSSKRKLDSLAPAIRRVFLERALDRLRGLSPEDFICRAAVVCAVARRSA
jgi:SAM-dependent methyltransferase